MKILVLKPSSLGDILHALPAVHAAAVHFRAEIDWLVQPAFADITTYLPELHRNILFERRKLGKAASFLPAFCKLQHEIRIERYDAVLDLQGLLRSAAIGRLARSSFRAGPAASKEMFVTSCYSCKLDSADAVHALDKNNRMTEAFVAALDRKMGRDSGSRPLNFDWDMPVLKQFQEPVDQLFAEHHIPERDKNTPVIAFAPGARWKSKQWAPEFFAEVIRGLAAKYPQAVFPAFGASGEKQDAQKIAELSGDAKVINLCGCTTTGGLVEAIRKVSLLICNDSGPMHIAAALKVPVLAFFGPTSPQLTGPYSKNSCVLQPSLPCILCFRRYCDKNNLCHSSISAADAVAAADKLLTGELL